jgi:hypothetical protein
MANIDDAGPSTKLEIGASSLLGGSRQTDTSPSVVLPGSTALGLLGNAKPSEPANAIRPRSPDPNWSRPPEWPANLESGPPVLGGTVEFASSFAVLRVLGTADWERCFNTILDAYNNMVQSKSKTAIGLACEAWFKSPDESRFALLVEVFKMVREHVAVK